MFPQLDIPVGYKPQSEDTSPAADRLLFYLMRQRSQQWRVDTLRRCSLAGHQLCLTGIKHQYPDAAPELVRREFIRRSLGAKWCHLPYQTLIVEDHLKLAQKIATIPEQLEIVYAIGGSLASGMHGEARSTRAVDLMALLTPEDVGRLFQAVTGQFYMDEQTALDAVR